MARAERGITSFSRVEGIIYCQLEFENGELVSLLDVRDDTLYMSALNEPLDNFSENLQFALNETPIIPDSPLLNTDSVQNRVASIWSLLPLPYGNVQIIGSLLLQIFQSLPVDILTFTATNNICVSTTENAQQTDETWFEYAKV